MGLFTGLGYASQTKSTQHFKILFKSLKFGRSSYVRVFSFTSLSSVQYLQMITPYCNTKYSKHIILIVGLIVIFGLMVSHLFSWMVFHLFGLLDSVYGPSSSRSAVSEFRKSVLELKGTSLKINLNQQGKVVQWANASCISPQVEGSNLAIFACMFDDYLWKSYVYRTTFSNVKYQDLCATINPSKIKYVFRFKQSFINFLYKKAILNVQ